VLFYAHGRIRRRRARSRQASLKTGKVQMAKNQNTFEKRRREVEKKQRADEKRKRRVERKSAPPESERRDVNPPPVENDE
jgi:hypothetical protein